MADPGNTASIKVMQRLGMRYVNIETYCEQACATYRLECAAYLK